MKNGACRDGKHHFFLSSTQLYASWEFDYFFKSNR